MANKTRFNIKIIIIILSVTGVLCAIFAVYLNTQSNRFFLAVFSNDKLIWDNINKNKQEKQLGVLGIFSGEDITSNTFRIKGKNIKSVSFESPDSYFVDYAAVARAPDNETKLGLVSPPPGSILIVDEYIYDALIVWEPGKLINAKVYGDYGGDYTKYLTNIITVTVIFKNGREITQIIKITVDETTGKTFAQEISME